MTAPNCWFKLSISSLISKSHFFNHQHPPEKDRVKSTSPCDLRCHAISQAALELSVVVVLFENFSIFLSLFTDFICRFVRNITHSTVVCPADDPASMKTFLFAFGLLLYLFLCFLIFFVFVLSLFAFLVPLDRMHFLSFFITFPRAASQLLFSLLLLYNTAVACWSLNEFSIYCFSVLFLSGFPLPARHCD